MEKMSKREAGRRGGLATLQKHGRDHFCRIGKMGADTFHRRYTLVPVGLSRFAIFTREADPETGQYRFVGYTDGGKR